MTPSCAHCRFCVITPINPHDLTAERNAVRKRFPPVAQVVGADAHGNLNTVSVSPPTHPDNWCGEFQEAIGLAGAAGRIGRIND